ncbi:MAG TPA: sortase [Actinomycetota bacterium]
MRSLPRRILRATGTTLLVLGFVVLAYIAWLLWGTGIYTDRAQQGLREEFNRPQGPTELVSLRGDAIAILRIPRIEVDVMVVEGTDVLSLKKGPGHYDKTDYWWEDRGTVGIAGHRTTYGAPFWDLNKVRPGDLMEVVTRRGTFTYEVTGSKEVLPSAIEVLEPTRKPTMVLTTCTPRFSAARRLVVFAERIARH